MKLGTAMVALTGTNETSDLLEESGGETKAGKVICLDAMLSSADAYKILTQSGKDMSIDLPTIQPRFSAYCAVFNEIMNTKSDILDVRQKYVLREFYYNNSEMACTILRVLFEVSTLTGDLQYFVDGLKSIADILINHDESASKDGKGDGILRTIAGLFNFAVSAETLMSSEELTRYEYATLVHAIFAGCSLAQVLYDIYQNPCFLSKYGSDEHLVQSMHLCDVLDHAKNCSTNKSMKADKALKGKMGAQIHKGMSQNKLCKAKVKVRQDPLLPSNNKLDEVLLLDDRWETTDCVISGITTGLTIPSICDIFECKSMHDLKTHKWFAFCMYYMCLVTFYAAYLALIRCKKYVTTLNTTFLIGWTGSRMLSTNASETNECITDTLLAKLTTMKHTITHVLSSISHCLVPHMTPLKMQRRRLTKKRHTIIMLAVMFIVPIIAGSQQDDSNMRVTRYENAGHHLPEDSLLADRFEDGAIVLADVNKEQIVSITDNVNEVLLSLRQYSPNDTENIQEVLQASAKAILFLKDQLASLQPMSSTLLSIEPLFETLTTELMNAENHLKSIERFVPEQHTHTETKVDASIATGQRILSSQESSSWTHYRKSSSISKADYYLRAQSQHLQRGNNIGKSYESQQGYHPARQSRRDTEGQQHRRLNHANGQCAGNSTYGIKLKQEQCLRLAQCAQNYNLYDLFVYFFGDDIDFDTGSIDKDEKISPSADLYDIPAKLSMVKTLANDILGSLAKVRYVRVQLEGTGALRLAEVQVWDENGVVNRALNKLATQSSTIYHGPEKAVNGITTDFSQTQENKGAWWEVDLGADAPVSSVKVYNKADCCTEKLSNSLVLLKDNQGRTVKSYRIGDATGKAVFEFKNSFEVGLCDQLLQQFHRFDEELSVQGKWQGGSVTGVCRGWGTSKFISLESMYRIVNTTLIQDSDVNEKAIVDVFEEFVGCADTIVKKLGKVINPSKNTNPFNHNTNYLKLYSSVKDGTGNKDEYGQLINTQYLDDILNFQTSLPPLTRRVRVDLGRKELLGMRELQVFNYNNTNKAQNKNATQSSTYSYRDSAGVVKKRDASYAVDGKFDTFSYTDQDKKSWWEVNLGEDVTVKYVRIFNHMDGESRRLSWAKVSLIDKAGNYLETSPHLGKTDGISDFNISFGLGFATSVFAWNSSSPAGQPLLTDEYKTQLRVQFKKSMDIFDKAIALVFGNKTTIGQVCSFATGLTSTIISSIPGFCCLDAPYQSKVEEWGEKFSCQKYSQRSDGSEYVVQKSDTDCNRLGPITSGFNEAACDVFQGTWCPSPRDCSKLVDCVNGTTDGLRNNTSRQAFFTYMNGAPKIKLYEVNDPTKCGALRAYFDYDKDFPDDDRICNEVKELQCFTDFSNLDGYATGVKDVGKNEYDTTVIKTKLSGFDPVPALAWRSANFAMQKSIESLSFFRSMLQITYDSCMTNCAPPACTWCSYPMLFGIVTETVTFALVLVMAISEHLYAEIVDGKDGDAAAEQDAAVYKNVLTIHKNVIATYDQVSELKKLVLQGQTGASSNARRLQVIDCTNTTLSGYVDNCNKPSCENPTKLCDGSYNYEYIYQLERAGCDDLDSDGDGIVDNCEDQYPPELFVRNIEAFRCDYLNTDASRLCYTAVVFQDEKQVETFLRDNFVVIDDCPATKLDIEIKNIEGTACKNTRYTVKPIQDTGCTPGPRGQYNITHLNPLDGTAKEVTVYLDDSPPSITCGFNHAPHMKRNNSVSADGKTLYHRLGNSVGSRLELHNAEFFYTVNDNCDKSDVQINAKLETNELHQSKIAEIIEYNNANSTCQFELVYKDYSCRDSYDCKTDPAMEGLAIRLYEITIEGSDAAGNIGSDQCRVIIIPSNMTIQDADAVLQKSSVRFPVATTTDLGIMLETKTNIILGYVYDVGQEIFNMIDASQSITNRAQTRDLMVADKERDLKILKENTPTNSNFDPRKMAEVEIWKFVAAVAIGICVGMVVGICVGVVVGVKL